MTDTADLFERVRLRRQWVLAPKSTRTSAPRTWRIVSLHRDYQLRYHPDTKVLRWDSTGRVVVLIGVAVSSHASESTADWLSQFGAASPSEQAGLLDRLAGTYVVITSEAKDVRLYTDPAGMMQGFRRGGAVASSPSLFPDLELDRELATQFRFGPDNDWYPGDLTPYRDLRAVRANHELSLISQSETRFWPRAQPPTLAADVGTAQLAALLRELVHGLLDSVVAGSVLCSLTGGKDSRVNLASLRNRTSEVRFFTLVGPGTAPCDAKAAEELARNFNLPHDAIPPYEPPDWLLHLYDEIAAKMSIGARREVVGRLLKYLDVGAVHLNGNLGALAKGFFWHRRQPVHVRPETLLKEFVDRPSVVRAASSDWLDSVPDLPATTVYNLMYLEQRGGRWMGPGEAASGIIYDSFSPFCSREVFDLICSLPVDTQRDGKLLVDVVGESWPELLDVPYCRSSRRWTAYVPRSVKNRLKRLAL